MSKIKIILIICVLICANMLFSLKPKKENVEVVFWTVQLSPFSNYINGVIDSFESQHPYIKVKWVDIPYSEAEKRVLASLLSSSMPDLINITSDFNMTLAAKGALAEVDENLNSYNRPLLKAVSSNDKVWGIPFYATSAVTIYNKELMNSFGILAPPKTYSELFEQIKVAKVETNKFLFMPTLTENDTLYKLLNKFDITTPQKLTTQNSKELFELLKMFYQEGKIPKEAITQTHREVLEKYSSGQIVYLQAGANFLNIIKENSLDVYNKTDVAQQFYEGNGGFDFSLMTLAVPKKAKNKAEAFLFAKYLTNAANQLEFAKITGILPCNKITLSDQYFSDYNQGDLISKARYIGAKQLTEPISYLEQDSNYKNIIVLLNSLIEKILLEDKSVAEQLNQTSKKWIELIK